jgi:hypothetical protein
MVHPNLCLLIVDTLLAVGNASTDSIHKERHNLFIRRILVEAEQREQY